MAGKRGIIPNAADKRLSPREREVIRLYKNGLTGNQVAVSLGVSEGTVRIHLKNARLKTTRQ